MPAKGSLLLPGLLDVGSNSFPEFSVGNVLMEGRERADSEDKESQLFLYSHECHDTGGGYQGRNELK